jgi:hypothetical protein
MSIAFLFFVFQTFLYLLIYNKEQFNIAIAIFELIQ